MEGGAGVSPISSCTDSSLGSQPGSKALVRGQASHLAHLGLVSFSVSSGLRNVYWFGTKHTKLYLRKQNLQSQSMRLSAWKSLGPVGNVT